MTDRTRHQPELLSRREALRRVTALLGGTALAGQAALLGWSEKAHAAVAAAESGAYSNELFSAADVELLTRIADTILPETDTPGAAAAGVGPFIALMVQDAYYPEEQEIFTNGLAKLNAECVKDTGGGFLAATDSERLTLLERLDKAQWEYSNAAPEGAPVHYFRMLKELTLFGYFTSEIGCTQARRYAETPGRYDPCAPYKPGEKAWADHA
jgi:glucoside 3-dehydrogenase (cytochrome c) hitch-hiker subunit